MDMSQITEHMPVMGSDGEHVGTVDGVEGDRIKLTKSDPSSGGQHHYIPASMVASIESGGVRLSQTAAQARSQWMAAG